MKETIYNPKNLKLEPDGLNLIKRKETTLYFKREETALYYGIHPYISVDPETGERIEVATSAEDIANREKLARRLGISPDQISAPPPKQISIEEWEERQEIIKKLKLMKSIPNEDQE